MTSNDKIDQLYDALKADGAVSKSRDNFRAYISDESNSRKLFDALKADGAVTSKDYDEFASKLGIKPSVKNTTAVADVKPQETQEEQTEDVIDNNDNPIIYPNSTKEIKERVDNTIKYVTGKPMIGNPWKVNFGAVEKNNLLDNKNLVRGNDEYNPDTGKLEPTYITSSGNRYTNKAMASSEQKTLDKYIDEQMKYEKEMQHMPSLAESAAKSVGSGFIRAFSGFLDMLQSMSSGLIVEDASSPSGYTKTRSYEESLSDKKDPLNRATSYLNEKADKLSKEAHPYSGHVGFLDLLWSGQYDKFLQKGIAVAGESLPMTLSALNPYTMVLNGISMAGSNFRQQTIDNPNIPAYKRAAMAIGSAAIEQAVEKWADPFWKYVKRGISPKQISQEITRDAAKNISKRIYKGLGGLAKDAAGEGAEEVVTNFGNDALGELLDVLSGDKDYGLRAQWEETKKNNPEAKLIDLAIEKGKEAVESFVAGAMAGAYTAGATNLSIEAVNYGLGVFKNSVDEETGVINPIMYDIAQSFDDGYAATDDKAMVDAYLSSAMAERKLGEVLDDKTIKSLRENPYETLSGIKDQKASQAALDYLTSKAAYDGVVQRIKNDADNKADAKKEFKEKILHKDGVIRPAYLKITDENGNNEKVYIVEGNVVMTSDGTMIDAEKSDKTVTVYDPITNKNIMISPSSELGILSLDNVLTGEEYDAIVENERNKYIAEQLSKAQGKINAIPGSKITLPTGESAVVLDTDGENITAQTEDGNQVQVKRSELQKIADEVNASDYAKRNASVGGYMLNSNVSLNTANGAISGKVIAEENEDGLITVETDKPINGKFVNQFTTEQLDKLVAQEQDGKVDGKKDEQDNGVIQGEPSEYSKGLVMTITDEDGSEKQATVVGRVRYENGKFVPDENGNIVEYTVDGELRHDRIDNMKDKVVSHVAPTSTEPQAPETDEERVIRNGIAGVGEGLRNAVNEQAESVRENDINNWLQKPTVADAMRRYGEVAQSVEEVVQRALADNPNDETKAALNDIMRFDSSKQLVHGYISQPQIVQQAETPVQPTEHPTVEPMPMVGSGDKAEPDFIKTTPQRGHRYIYEESGLSREEANQFVGNNIEAASKSLEKAKKKSPKIGTNIAKYNKEKSEWERKVSDAQAMLDYWKAVKSEQDKIVSKELEEKSKRDADTHEKAVAEEQKRQEEEIAKRDKQKNLGANAVHPAIIGKWESSNKIDGEENEITLANGEKIKGHYVLVESGAATPSHNPNNNFAKNEGFPVDDNGNTVNDRDYERDKDAQSITKQMASNYDSRALQSVPVVSNDGVILSGNGRTMAGEIAAQNNTDGAYIEYLQKYPKQFGFTDDQVKSMKHPRVLFVADGNIPYTTENFAKFNAQDMKSQSRTEQSVKLGKTVDDATFGRIIKIINAFDTIGEFYNDVKASTSAISELRDTGAINAMQYAEMFDGEKISEIGKQILENMLVGKAFEKNPDAVRQLSDIPSLRQSVISALAEISNNVGLGADFSLESELAEAIKIAYQARKNGYKSGERVSGYARQLNLFQFDDGESVADYTNATVLMLADVINDSRVSQLKKVLSLYNTRASDSASGQIDIFSGGVKTKEEIIKEVLNILNYGTKEEQGKAISESVNKRKAASVQQDGTAGGYNRGGENAGRSERGTEETPTLTHDEAISLIALMEERANVAPEVELTIENWDALFGEDGRVVTPIGEVKMGENQFTKLMRQGREGKLGMVKPTLENPDVIIEDASEAKDGDTTERASSYIFIRSFKKADGSRFYYFTSITVSKEGREVVVSSQEKSRNKILRLLQEGSVIWRTPKDATTSSAERQGLDYEQPNEAETATKGSGITPQSTSSESKDTTISSTTNELEEKNVYSTIGEQIQAAEAEVNTNPTEAQKEAGNYKKGHLKIDGFDVSIENPKGSVRSGTDASDNKWEQTMNNSYGYIRGTEGVDGDHIDVFFSEDPSQGDVFVVDQVNKDGSFDEHKVMYGFPDMESAKKAYLSNYEEGWQGLGAITPVSKEEFKKWVQSSHRKTKPFAEYRSVNPLGDTQLGEQPTAAYSIEPTTYTNKKGKTTPMHLVTFGRELSKDEIRAGKELAKESRGWWDRDKGGFMMRDEDSAKSLAEALNNDESVSDAQPISMSDIQSLNNGDVVFTEPKQPKEQPKDEEYHPIWQYSIHIDADGYTTISRDDVSSGYPIGDARFRHSTDSPEEMLDILRNPLNGMQEALEAVGVTLENKIKTRELDRKIKEEREQKRAELRTNGVNGYKIGDKVIYTPASGTRKAINATIHDFEEFGENKPVLDVGLAPVMYEVAEWGDISKSDAKVKVQKVNVESLIGELYEKGEAKLSDHVEQPSNPSGNSLVTDERYAEENNVDKPADAGTEQDPVEGEGTRAMQLFDTISEGDVFVNDNGLKVEIVKKVEGKRKGISNSALKVRWTQDNGKQTRKTGDVKIYNALHFMQYLEANNLAKADAPAEEQKSSDNWQEKIASEPKNEGQFGLVSDERMAELKDRLRKKLGGQMNIGIDPEILAIGLEIAVGHLDRGVKTFTDFAKVMIYDLGDAIRPYLKAFYNGARELPEVVENGLASDMTSYDEVQSFDVANFDKQGIDAFATAETVTREAEVAQEVEAAQERIKKIRSIKKETKKKSVTSQEQTGGLFDELFDNENNNDNGLQRNDAIRSEGVSANGNRHEQGLSRGSETGSESEQQGSRGTDLGGERTGDAVDRTVRPRLLDTVTEPHNTRNNHSERGKDHAPTSVDARIEANINAIELVNQLLESGEQATDEQMQILRKFSGWGGLGKAFSEDNISNKLRELLGEEAYIEAKKSKYSSFYTPAYVIDTLWDIAEKMGFNGGNILEGSAGIGNILGQMPTHISERSDIHAIEIDRTSGGILSLLYPDAKVDIQGFEQTHIPNGSVDLAITNVPFITDWSVRDTSGDKDLSKKFHNIHDFCIAKNVRKLREGGLGIFITSNGTLDNSKKLRDWIVNEGGADFVGAFRMHNKTFGGTGVTSDIIVIRKRVNGKKSANSIDVSTVSGERVSEYDTGDTRKLNGKKIPVIKQLSMDYNQYFIEHPEMMAGEMHFGFEKGDMYRPTSKGLYPKQDKKQEQMLAEFVQSFTAEDFGEKATDEIGVVDVMPGKKIGEVFISDGKLYINAIGAAKPLEVNDNKVKGHTKVECFKAYSAIKESLSAVLEYQITNEDDNGLKPLLDKLNKAYDDFIATYGHFNKNTAIAFLRNDVDYANVASVENYEEIGDGKGGIKQTFSKADVMKKRVVEKEKEPAPTNVKDGIIASIFKFGRIDIPYIAEQLGKNEAEIKAEIIESGYGFEDPSTIQVEVSYQYLSGNVREKLRQAQENNENGVYDRNIKALQEIIPMDIPAHLIDFTLGSSWIEPKLYEEYVKERTDVDVQFTAVGGTWFMNEPYFTNYEKNRAMGVTSEMLGSTVMGHTLIEAAIQNRSITVSTTKKNWDGSTETITDKEATQACAAKIDEIRQDFKEWARQKMQSDAEMSERMERIYNDTFNNYVPMSIPDEFVPEYFGGASHKFKMRPHQGRAIVRGTMQPLLLAHEVGTGKTFTLISTAMEMRRLGTARKPMIVVQNATVGQFVASAKELYPNAKILTLEEADRSADGRKNFYAKIRYNDWDMIVVPQSTFEFIPDSEERQMTFVQDKIEEKMLVLEKMKEADPKGNSMITRQAEREIAALEEQLAELSDSSSKKRTAADEKKRAIALQNAEVKALEMLDRRTDDVENFDDMGIDALLIDEAHEYKHLGFATAMQRGVKGVDPSYSKKSQGVFLKTQAVLEKNNGRNVIFATGTPISNTAAEIWTFMRYLMPADTMKEYGIYYFDDFVRNFGNIQQMLEFTTSGKFKENNRFAGYVNLPELVRIWSGVSDTVLTKDAGGVSDKIPEMESGKAQDIYLPQTRALRSIMKFVKAQLEEYDKMSGKEKKENSHIPLTMYGIAKAAAVDARLVQSDAEDDTNSKTNEAVRQTLRSLQETAEYKGTVAIFADNYQNKESGFNLYEDIRAKLIAEGVPANEIVVMKSGMTVKKKLEIFEKVNRGEVRVILGSTFTLGTGVNIQERLHTLIHLDAPNRPMDYTQRNGRILRQGNLHKEMGKPVRILRFGVEDSLDVTAYQRLKTKGAIADSIMNGKQMMANSMTNRVLEEDEDVFGDTVAQLSGSEYAMLKNNAEKNVRKYASRKKQWEADQTYIHNAKPRVKSFIKDAEKRIEDNSRYLEAVRTSFPDGKFKEIVIGKHRFTTIDAMEDFFKEHNKSLLAEMKQMKDGEIAGDQKRQLTIQIGDFSFVVTTKLTRHTIIDGVTLFNDVERKMTYSCAELGIENIPVRQNLLRNAIDDITNNVITGRDFSERLEAAERSKKYNEAELEQLLSREGKPFEYESELEQAKSQYEEYSELMKKELEQKEAKYAEMDADVDVADNISNTDEDDGTLYRTSYEIEAEYPNWLEGTTTDSGKHSTQVEGTRKTYKKVGDWIEENLGKDVAILDASSGMGYGTADLRERGFNIEDVEPYQSEDRKLNNPATYSSYDDIDTQYDYIISNAVLNVIPDDWRAGVLHSMAEKLKDGGKMFINTRKAGEEKSIKDKIELDSPQEVLVKRNGRIASYQRFFTPQELKEWVESELGDSYTVEVANKANSGTSGLAAVVVTKNNESHANGKIYSRDGIGAYTDDELALESDPISKALGKPRGTRMQRREVAERERQRMVDRVEKLAKKLNLDNVEVVTDASTLEGKKQRAKGFYTKSTGKITIVIPNHSSTFDVEQTLLHEAVAHYGLRQLFGEHFDTFLDNVFNNADDAIRQRIVALAAKNGWDFHKATEEYLAMLAEDTEFENTNASWWMKIKDFFLDMLHKIGFEDFRRVTLTDNELRYILWRSYENLEEPGRYRSILGEARDIAMQYDLNVGNYSSKEVTTMDESTRVAGDTNDVMFREEEFSPRDRVTARDAYERMVSSGSYQFQEAVQDSMLGLKKLYEAVLGKNMRIEDVAGFENAYLAENRMSSENCAEQHEHFVRFLKPLLNAIYKISGTDENMRQELIDYMMAKHGLERNKIMAQRDFDSYKKQYPKGSKTLEDFRERDYAGLTALTGEEDVFKAEESAKKMIDSYESKNVVDELWSRVNDATSATLAKIYASGLLSNERYEQIKSMYEYYIPLQGWDETTSDEIYGYLTSKDGPLGSSPIRRAYGRRSKADDPIATIAKMADDAIRQGNRNLMKQTFLNFVLNNPNDLVSVSDMWLKYDEVSDEWVPVFADINNGDSSSDVERKIREFESKMQELEKNNPDLYKRGNDAENIPYKVVKNNLKEHQILIRRNGRTYVLTINGNPRAAQALNGLTNPDVDTSGIVGNLLRGAQWINRNLSSAYTTRNPEFVASNFLRDMLYSNCMAWVKESPTYAIRFHKNFGKLNPVTMYKLIKKWENGTLNESDYTDRMFNQFMLNGGDTGYTNIKDIEGHKKEIAKQLKDNASNVRKAWSWIGDQLDMFNGSAEDCARFAAFITSRQMGRSIERSIYDAKEISVNFNKKGSGGKMVNATGQTTLGKTGSYVSGTGRLAYVFWNAGIQGTTNFARAAKRNPSKAIAGAACMFTLGMVIPMLAKLMSGGDDDDKDAYYNLPEYIRRSNIALNAGDQWITIPLPIEFRMFYGLGELACGVITRNERYSDSELAYQIASLASQILPLDMLEGGGGINPFIPSSVKSGVEAYVLNKSWSGLPIYKDTPWNKNEPEWTKAYKNANTFLVSSSKWLNDISGGDDHKKGYIDINPAQVEYVLKGVFGGAYTTIDKLAKMGETAVGDRQFEWQNMLIASRMVRTGDERTEAKKLKEEYFKYKDSYEETKRLLKRYSDESEKDERYQKKLESLKKTNDYLIYDVFGNFNPLLKALNDAKEGSSEETIKGIENEENALRREMINLIHDIEDDKNPDIDERVDDMLKREFDYGNISRDKAGDVIANRLGGMDSYGSPQNEYGNIYKNIRDYVDLAEDVSLQVELKQAKDAGDDMRARTIESVRRTITNVKKRLEKTPYKLEDGTEVTDSDVMEELRRIRRNAIEELGISYPYKSNR